MKILVYYNNRGKILGTMKVVKKNKNLPKLGIMPEKGGKVTEIEVSRNFSKLSLLEIHKTCKISFKKGTPSLVQRTKSKRKI